MKNKIIAVSGGPDSMFLLNKMIGKNNGKLIVAHVNYNFRKESIKEEKMVKDFCLFNNIKIEVLNVDEEVMSQYEKEKNKQKKAREIRYDFFKKIAIKYNTNQVYIAHHKDDFIETAIMQNKRSNDYLFYGLKKNNKIKEIYLKRILLNKWKSEIIKKCNKKNIPYMIDSSNYSNLYERNRVRNDISKLEISEKENIYKEFIKKNKKLKSKYKNVNKIYDYWSLSKYEINYFLLQKKEIKNNIIYMYLSKNNLSINKNKIDAIINFLEKSIKNKEFRIKENIYILNNGKQIEIINKER